MAHLTCPPPPWSNNTFLRGNIKCSNFQILRNARIFGPLLDTNPRLSDHLHCFKASQPVPQRDRPSAHLSGLWVALLHCTWSTRSQVIVRIPELCKYYMSPFKYPRVDMLTLRFGELIRKIWNVRGFKVQPRVPGLGESGYHW